MGIRIMKGNSMAIIYDISKLSQEIQDQITSSDKYTKWFSEFPSKLLSIGADAKTVKGEKYGVLTAILYLAPHKLSGQNICSMADVAGCSEPCLNVAGRGAMTSVQMSRIRKTLYMQQHWLLFVTKLQSEIQTFSYYCDAREYTPAVRLNGTSDIRWENKIWDYMVYMAHWFGVRWYDYTKIANRIIPDPKIYDLTFSYSGVPQYRKFVDTAKAMGMRLAVVFRYQDKIPKVFEGRDVVDGDDSDLRFLEPNNVVSALYAKGKAVHDTSGFVIGEIA